MKIKKPILKITSLLLIIGLNYSGLFGVGETIAHFNDKEISENNVYTAGTLDFSLHSEQNDFVSEVGDGNGATRTIQVHQEGNLPFKYTIRTKRIGDDNDFCKTLKLEARLGGEVKYPVVAGGENSLMNLDFQPVDVTVDPPLGANAWQFKINAPNNSQNKTCEFKFVFEGWQDNMESHEENGFDDVEEIENSFSFSGQQNSSWVRVDRPNGGETWYTVPDFYITTNNWCEDYGSFYDMDDNQCRYYIEWSTSADIPEGEGDVDIWFCNKSGDNCFYPITADGPTENDGVYEWRIPSNDKRFIGDEDRIKIVISRISGGGSVSDMTDENFCPLIPPFEPSGDDLELLKEGIEESEDDVEVEVETENTADEENADVEKDVEAEVEDVDTDEFEIEDAVAVEEDIEDKDIATDDADDDDDDDDDEEEDVKDEEVVLAPKKGVSLDDDDDDDKEDADDGEDEIDEKEVFEELELDIKEDIKEEIEEINNSDFSQSDGAEDNFNKKSVDCVQAVK